MTNTYANRARQPDMPNAWLYRSNKQIVKRIQRRCRRSLYFTFVCHLQQQLLFAIYICLWRKSAATCWLADIYKIEMRDLFLIKCFFFINLFIGINITECILIIFNCFVLFLFSSSFHNYKLVSFLFFHFLHRFYQH